MRLVCGSESLCCDVTLVKLAPSIHISMMMIFPPQELWGNYAILFGCESSLEQQCMLGLARKTYRKKKFRKWLGTLGSSTWWSLRTRTWTNSHCFSRWSQNEVTLEIISESAQGRAKSSSDGEKMWEESGKTEWDAGLEALDPTGDTIYPRAVLQTSVRCTQPLQFLPHPHTASIGIYLSTRFLLLKYLK